MRKMNRAITLGLVLLAALWNVPPARGGGFYVTAESPDATVSSKARGAVLVVRALGCHTPSDAVIKASAEGLNQGRRETISLELIHISPGVYAVKQQWPDSGAWLVSINGKYLGATRSLLVNPSRSGNSRSDKTAVRNGKAIALVSVDRNIAPMEIDSALEQLSSGS